MALGLLLCGCAEKRVLQSPAERIAEGWTDFRRGDYTLAAACFEEAVRLSPPGSPDRQAALFGSASVWGLQRPGGDGERAAARYREAIEANPTNDLAAWSGLGLARLRVLEAGGGFAEPADLHRAYQEVIDRFPFHAAGEEAFLLQQSALLERALTPSELETVLRDVRAFLAGHPQTPYASSAWRLIGAASERLGLKEEWLEALLQELRTAETDPSSPTTDRALTYWRIATVAEFVVGDFALARDYYGRLIREYPADQRIFLARSELGKMDAWEAGFRTGRGSGEGTP